MSYVQNRVYVKDFGTVPVGSSLLVPIPTAPWKKQQQYVHKAIYPDTMSMFTAIERDLGIKAAVASGHRPPLWGTEEEYKAAMIAQYGSVEAGRVYRAFASAHQTGLAIDFGCGGLAPTSATIPKQKKTKLYRWIVDHAFEFGFHPYFPEPWHLEHKVSLDQFRDVSAGLTSAVVLPPVNDVCEDGYCEEVTA